MTKEVSTIELANTGVQDVHVYPWPHSAYDDCWWCEHDDADGATYHASGEIKICLECLDLLDAGGKIAKQGATN
jgi:hypothetical protein